MVEMIKGDIFTDGIGVLIHQANCHHSMQSGIAKEIRERYVEAYAADLLTPKADYGKLGTFSATPIAAPGRLGWIVNLYSQYGHQDGDRRTSYDAMLAGMLMVRNDARFAGLDFCVPYKIGCGLAGGNWTVVRAIMEAIFTEPYVPGSPQPVLRILAKPEAGALS